MNTLGKLGLCLAIGISIGVALDDVLSGFGIAVGLWIIWGLVGRRAPLGSESTNSSSGDSGSVMGAVSRDDRIDNDGRWDDTGSDSGGSDSGGGDGGGGD